MTTFNYTNILTQAVDELSESQSYKGLFHQHKDGDPLPSAKSLYKIVELARAIIFPGYFGNSTVNSHTINYHIGVNVETPVRPADRTNSGRTLLPDRKTVKMQPMTMNRAEKQPLCWQLVSSVNCPNSAAFWLPM